MPPDSGVCEMPCGRVCNTSMSVEVLSGTWTGIASAIVASNSVRPRNGTGAPASHGSRAEASIAVRISRVVAQVGEVDDPGGLDIGRGAVQLDLTRQDPVGVAAAAACARPR